MHGQVCTCVRTGLCVDIWLRMHLEICARRHVRVDKHLDMCINMPSVASTVANRTTLKLMTTSITEKCSLHTDMCIHMRENRRHVCVDM